MTAAWLTWRPPAETTENCIPGRTGRTQNKGTLCTDARFLTGKENKGRQTGLKAYFQTREQGDV